MRTGGPSRLPVRALQAAFSRAPMKKDILWTLGGITLLGVAVIAVIYTPDGGLQAKIAPTPEESRPSRGNEPPPDGATTSSPRRKRDTRPAPKAPVHWATAPYATPEDAFAVVLQPRGLVQSPDFASLEAGLGDLVSRDVAGRTAWIAIYGRSVKSELDLARNLTYVICQTEPTTSVDLAAERFPGRKLTDELFEDVSYVRIAPTTESVLIERADKGGNYTQTNTEIEHDALAIVEHDPRTFLVVSEGRLPQALAALAGGAPLTRSLAAVPHEAHCAFVCGPSSDALLETLARAGGDRSAALVRPVLELLKGASEVRFIAGLGPDHLAQATVTFANDEASTRTLRLLTGLRDSSRALLDDVAAVAAPTSETTVARRLLDTLRFDQTSAEIVVTLPRPADLRELLGGGQVSAR